MWHPEQVARSRRFPMLCFDSLRLACRRTRTSRVLVAAGGAGALALTLALAAPARAVQVSCGASEGDGFGWSVDSSGDFDGDGKADIAVGGPCAQIGDKVRAGRVRVFSGATGRRLVSLRGADAEQQFGAALALIPDVDGDGKAELAVGSPTYAVPKEGSGTILRAGKLELFSSKGGVIWTLRGTTQDATLGEAVTAIADVDGDGKADVMVGASGVKIAGERRGTAFIVSGTSGAVLGRDDGEHKFDYWGSTLGTIGDVDGDGHPDLVIASNSADRPIDSGLASAPWGSSSAGSQDPAQQASDSSTTTTVVTTTTTMPITVVADVGRVKILSGLPPFTELARMEGEEDDRLGRSLAATPDLSGDGADDLWIGAMGKDVNGLGKAGIVALYTSAGDFVRSMKEPTPQAGAAFGTAVAVPGSLDGDAVEDVVASAPVATVAGKAETGRIHAFDGVGGGLLWSRNGTIARERFGQVLSAGFDYDGDGVGDVVAGAPGDAARGRRGAGSAYVLSGANGRTLAGFSGRRGRETRLFVAGTGDARRPLIRSFDPFGRARESEIEPFRDGTGVSVTMALLDDAPGVAPEVPLLVVGNGSGASDGEVAVYRAVRRRSRVSRFAAGPLGYTGGVNVAAGDLSSEEGDEIAAAPADAADVSTDVVIYRRQFVDPRNGHILWTQARTFPLFAEDGKVEGRTVHAAGVYLAAGNLTDAPGDELAVGPVAGLPAVRVFNRNGGRVSEWLAYPPEGTSGTPNAGTAVAVGDLDGSGFSEIVTAPASGEMWIRAWTASGAPFKLNGKQVSFFFTDYGQDFTGGVRLAVADVDFDGKGEIVVVPGAGRSGPVFAFEGDGQPVSGWAALSPFGPAVRSGLNLVATDNFRRR